MSMSHIIHMIHAYKDIIHVRRQRQIARRRVATAANLVAKGSLKSIEQKLEDFVIGLQPIKTRAE